LNLSQPDVAAFIKKAPVATSPSAPASEEPPKRGHVIQASGRVVRRLVVNIDPELGAELERLRNDTGASLSRIANDLLRSAVGL
jgi:hypothetical protein